MNSFTNQLLNLITAYSREISGTQDDDMFHEGLRSILEAYDEEVDDAS